MPDVAATYSIEFYELKPSFSYIEGLRKGANDGIVLGREEEFCGFAPDYDVHRNSLSASPLQHFKKGYFRGIKEDYSWGYDLNVRYRSKYGYSHYMKPCPRDRINRIYTYSSKRPRYSSGQRCWWPRLL